MPIATLPPRATEALKAWGLGLMVLGAVAWPALQDPPKDGFPLSTYPMFSSRRGKPWVHVASGVTAEGELVRLSPRIAAGGPEVMQASATLARAVRRGRAAAICEEIADRAAAEALPYGSIRIESKRFDPLTYFDDPPPGPVAHEVRAECAVP